MSFKWRFYLLYLNYSYTLKLTKMKSFFLLIGLMLTVNAIAQSDSLSNNRDTLYLASGFKVVVGQSLKIGVGSTPSGTFKYIRNNANSLFNYTSNTSNNADNANSLPRNMSGMSLKIKRIDIRGTKKMGYVYYPILKQSMFAYECDIKNAILSNEIEVPEEFKPKVKPSVVVIQKASAADEIVKYKKLLDDGVINKEEFEAKKKKLLEDN